MEGSVFCVRYFLHLMPKLEIQLQQQEYPASVYIDRHPIEKSLPIMCDKKISEKVFQEIIEEIGVNS